MAKRLVIGLVENIEFQNGKVYKAKIDTGADSSSVDRNVLAQLGENERGSHKFIKSSLGKAKRQTVYLDVVFHGMKLKERFSIADRSHLKYKVLVGKTLLRKKKLLIDPCLSSVSANLEAEVEEI